MTTPIITDTPDKPDQPDAKALLKWVLKPDLRWSMISGILMWLAHPAAGLWILAWVGLFPLFVNVFEAKSFGKAFLRGYVFSWFYFTPLCYWTGLTIVGWTGGNPIGWLALVGLSALMACYYGLFGGIAWLLTRKTVGIWRMFGFAGTWILMEFLRGAGSLTFPWGQIAYTQYRFLPLIQMSEVTGALGVGFLLALSNAAFAEWALTRKQEQSKKWVFAIATLTGLLCLSGFARMAGLKNDRPISVAIMQNNFANKDADELAQKFQTFDSLSEAAAKSSVSPPALFVWGESAAPGDAFNDSYPRQKLARLAEKYDIPLFTGSSSVDREAGTEKNSALLFTPGSLIPQRYDKQGLVPFGEYIPYRNLIPLSLQKQFQFFASDITPGTETKTLNFRAANGAEVRLGPMVCYESVYSHYGRKLTNAGANLLVAPSNDQWFQTHAAMEQHVSIAVFRAVENRRDIARATTNGISCGIEGTGAVINREGFDTPTFEITPLHLRSLITVYTRFGDWIVWVILVLVCLSPFSPKWSVKTPKKSKSKP